MNLGIKEEAQGSANSAVQAEALLECMIFTFVEGASGSTQRS